MKWESKCDSKMVVVAPHRGALQLYPTALAHYWESQWQEPERDGVEAE
jgi:hypothetical protein